MATLGIVQSNQGGHFIPALCATVKGSNVDGRV